MPSQVTAAALECVSSWKSALAKVGDGRGRMACLMMTAIGVSNWNENQLFGRGQKEVVNVTSRSSCA